MSKSPSYSAPALEKGLDLLEALAAQRLPQSLTELGQALHRSPSELFRMLNCLEGRGYIHRDAESGCYRLTLKLYELAHTHSPVDQLLSAAARPMRELAEQAGESCHLSVLSHGYQLVLAQAESLKPIRLSVEVGSRSPAVQTGSGRLMLAWLPTDELMKVLETPPASLLLNGSRRRELQASLEQIRARGYESAPSQLTLGVHDLAVPVGNPEVGAMAALAIPLLMTPQRNDQADKLIPAMLKCAKAITQEMGLNSEHGSISKPSQKSDVAKITAKR